MLTVNPVTRIKPRESEPLWMDVVPVAEKPTNGSPTELITVADAKVLRANPDENRDHSIP